MLFNSKSQCAAEVSCNVNGAWGLHMPIVEPVTPLLKKSYIFFYREREPAFKRLDSLCLFLTAITLVEIYTTSVVIRLEGCVIRTPLIALLYAKGNTTLLEMDYL
ncbi:hypothetical protein NPIL_519871 [Nephila pilipes]|uniref:Uncharacterized protein n=1 Tax=Nephila pilipes TaxID=299642 RepID=A0A8X6UJR2_NEPPI|nr:hypothetical protein NPIL_519871 [Nephila pilipes]